MIIVGNSNQSTTNPLNANMSNAKNNNLPVQSVAPPPGIAVDTASSSISTTRSSRPSQHESSRRRRTGGRAGNRGRQARHQDGRAALEDTPQTEAANLHSSSSPGGTLATTTPASDLVNRNLPTNRGHHRGGNARSGGGSGGGGGSGKYRQRQQTSQLIDGMESLTGLDIDLAESIVPTSSSTGRDLDASKRRHATNRRKMNLSHILNYKYERPNSRSNRYSGYTSTQRNSGSHYRDPGTNHKFSKQQFLQANCQFVVADGHDYTIHKVDPDWPVDWSCIEEVRFMQSASSETTCPICLEPPIAAKITRCGHIYCWTCMLHYLSLSDEKRRQCPICFEPVYKSDLRSVISHSFTNYSVDEEITMRLMIRKKGCVEAEHYNRCENPSASPSLGYITPHENLDSHDWSRANLVIVDPRTVVAKIAQRERNELEFKLETDRDQPEVCFVEQALSDLEERVNRLLDNTPDLDQNKAKVKDVQGSIKYGLSPTQAFSSDALKTYLFYQCSDGQHVYLNPFSTKVLCHEYGSLENCPLELRAKILQMDWISMNEAWRKRFRYLSHLPLTCEFRLIEIDFEKLDLVSAATYKTYEDQIKWREQEREKRRREERKRDKKIQVQQDRKIYGIQPSLKINLDSTDQFPSVSDERYLGLAQPRNQSRTDDSSDEDEFPNPTVQPVIASENDEQEISVKADDKEQVSGVITNVATSFRDIQLQEEELEARQKSNKLSVNQSAWNANKSSSSSSNQSSFAQLLVGAKSSQKQWSRSATSSRATQPVLSSSNQGANPNHHRQRLTSGSDEGGEELRAPPFECTISDFIDMNIVSSKKKGKKKS